MRHTSIFRQDHLPATSGPPTGRVADVMRRDIMVVPAWARIDPSSFPTGRAGATYPVLDAAGAPVGLLDPSALSRAPGSTAGEVCIPLDELRVLSPYDHVEAAGRRGRGSSLPTLVLDAGRLVGILPAVRAPRCS